MDFNKKNIALYGVLMLTIISYTVYYIKENKEIVYENDEKTVMPMIMIQPSYNPEIVEDRVFDKIQEELNKDFSECNFFKCECERSNKYSKYIIADFDIERFNDLREKIVKKFRNNHMKNEENKEIEEKEQEEFKLLKNQYEKSIIYTCMVDYETNSIIWLSIENRKRLDYKDEEERINYELDINHRKLVIEELKKLDEKIAVDHYIEKIIINDEKTIIEWSDDKERTIYKFEINKKDNKVKKLLGL
ncbi:MAG: hypothetical protein N4A54_04770 [Peptostreptococcaceae bacterium]|jgi:hypothetical protein|nr:hypothetical protein [Peptostreptococcaceae bacterium]